MIKQLRRTANAFDGEATRVLVSSVFWVFTFSALFPAASLCQQQKPHWVMGYFPSWELGNGVTNSNPPLTAIDFSSMTEVSYFGFNPLPTGVVDTVSTGANYAAATVLRKAAHTKDVSVVITIGGWNTQKGFEGATTAENIDRFVGNIVALVKNYGYDGVDIDWEPLTADDYVRFGNLARKLRAQLPHPYLLTLATAWGDSPGVAPVNEYFDQINIMTYDLMGAWDGWVTWFNSAVYDKNITVAWNKHVPSCDNIVREFTDAGIPISRLGIGAEFSGTVWKGGSMKDGGGSKAPGQSWTTPPAVQADVPLYWHDGSGIMQKYYDPDFYHWDSAAQAPYLSYTGTSHDEDMFISFDDSASIVAKADYIKTHNLGGLILYELGWGYPGKGTYPLLEVVRNAFTNDYPRGHTSRQSTTFGKNRGTMNSADYKK
jgi:chitinase